MFEDIQDFQMLQSRKQQQKLFIMSAESTEKQGYSSINIRKEDSILNQEDDISREYESQINHQSLKLNLSMINQEKPILNPNNIIVTDNTPQITKASNQIPQIKITQNNHDPLDYLDTDQTKKNSNNNQIINPKLNVSSAYEPNIKVIMMIKRQINIFLTKYTLIGKKINLTNEVARRMIGDQSDYQEIDMKHNLSQYLVQWQMVITRLLTKWHLDKLKLFNLQNNYMLTFKIITTFISYLFLFFLSIILLFNLRYATSLEQELVHIYITIQWLLEIMIKMNCSTTRDTKFIESRKEIITIYIKEQFLLDIIPIILLNVNIKDTHSWNFYFIKSLVFLKFINTERDLKAIQKQLVIITRKHYIIQIINLNLNLFFVGHLIACMWYVVGIIDSNYLDNQNSWVVTTNDFTAGDWWKVYIASFYWSFTLMATGSNIATSVAEQYFTSIIMPFTTIIFGYMINTIGIILSEIDQQEELKRKEINILNRYMDRKDISKDLQARVNLDLEYLYEKNYKKIAEEEESVLFKISGQLYKQLQYEYNMKVFKKMTNLSSNFSVSSLTELCYVAEEITFSPNQTIFVENQTTDSCLMYIISGSVQISQQVLKKTLLDHSESLSSKIDFQPTYHQEDKDKFTSRILGELKEGQTFGELNFFTGLGRQATIKSSSFTRILKISREDFMEIIQNNDKDLERYCEIRDKIQYYQNYSDLKFACTICQKSDHLNNTCPLTHFDKKNPFLFARINYSHSQVRDNIFIRKRQRYVQLFYKLQHVTNQAQEAYLNFIPLDQQEQIDYVNDDEYYDMESQHSEIRVSTRSIQYCKKQPISELKIASDLQSINEQDKSKNYVKINDPKDDMFKSNSRGMIEPTQITVIDSFQDLSKKNKRPSIADYFNGEDCGSIKRKSYVLVNQDGTLGGSQSRIEIQQQDIRKKSRQVQLVNQNSQQLQPSQQQQLNISQQQIQMQDRRQTIVQYMNNPITTIISSPQQYQMSKQNKQDTSYSNYNKTDEIIKDIILWNLDEMKQFNYYFPHGNFKNIINKIQLRRKRQITSNKLGYEKSQIMNKSKKNVSKKTLS